MTNFHIPNAIENGVTRQQVDGLGPVARGAVLRHACDVTSTVRRTSINIPGWPIVGPGLLMATVDNVVFMHLDDRMTDATFATYLRALEASLTNRPAEGRVAIVYDIPTFSALRALSARPAGEILKRHGDTLRQTTACFTLVTPSPLARAAVQTVFAVSRLSFPQRAVATISAAVAFASTILPEISHDTVARRIDEALVTHKHGMRG